MKSAPIVLLFGIAGVLLSGCNGKPDCDEMVDRYCEQACGCGEPSGHCAAGDPGDPFYEHWENKNECVDAPGFATLLCLRDSAIEKCYDALENVDCTQFEDEKWGLDTSEDC